MISRIYCDKLVKRLRNCATEAAPCNNCDMVDVDCCTDMLMKQSADAIEELTGRTDESILEDDWIPVTERLPSVEKEVYVTDGEYIARANLLDEVFPGDKPCWSYSGLGEITHWCEQITLPQPPKEESQRA